MKNIGFHFRKKSHNAELERTFIIKRMRKVWMQSGYRVQAL